MIRLYPLLHRLAAWIGLMLLCKLAYRALQNMVDSLRSFIWAVRGKEIAPLVDLFKSRIRILGVIT